jgi:pimeloyl-ACP methyl ester carboxylesterase
MNIPLHSRPLVLLLPGLMCDDTVWKDQIHALSPLAEVQVASYGLMDSLTDMARHAVSLAGSRQFAVAGHSMGGRVALEVCRLVPEQVLGLALLDTGCAPLAQGEAGEQERAGRMALLAQARAEGMRAMGQAWAQGMVHPDRLDSPLFEDILQMVERSHPAQFEAQIRALLARPDARPLLPQITCPVMLLCGCEDSWSPPSRHEEMHDAMPRSALDLVAHCGHMSTMEQPQQVSAAMLRWLQRCGMAVP